MNETVALVFDSGMWFVRAKDGYGQVTQLAGPCPTFESAIVEAALQNGGRVAVELVVPVSY